MFAYSCNIPETDLFPFCLQILVKSPGKPEVPSCAVMVFKRDPVDTITVALLIYGEEVCSVKIKSSDCTLIKSDET